MRSAPWVKIAAVLLLAWAAFDFIVPGICAVETAPLEAGIYLQHLRSPASGDTGTSESDTGVAEDCFCCCSHVLPRYSPDLVVVEHPGSRVRLPVPEKPTLSASILPRPPRV